MITEVLTQIEDEFKRRGTPVYNGAPLSRRYVIDYSSIGKAYLVTKDDCPELYLEVYMSGEPDVVVARVLDPADKGKTSRRFYGTTAVVPVAAIVDCVLGIAQRRVHQWEINEAYSAGRQAVIDEVRQYARANIDTATATFDVLEVAMAGGMTARVEFYLQDMEPRYKASISFLTPAEYGLDAVLERARAMAACGGAQ